MKKLELTTDLVEKLKHCVCPTCKSQLAGRTQIGSFDEHGAEVFSEGNHAIPEAGDASLCLYCNTKLFFVDGDDGFLRVRKMTVEEYAGLPQFVKDVLNVDIEHLREETRDDKDLFHKWAKQAW
jgi:hypothetical protein